MRKLAFVIAIAALVSAQAWSADGLFAFVAGDAKGPREIVVVNPDGSERLRIPAPTGMIKIMPGTAPGMLLVAGVDPALAESRSSGAYVMLFDAKTGAAKSPKVKGMAVDPRYGWRPRSRWVMLHDERSIIPHARFIDCETGTVVDFHMTIEGEVLEPRFPRISPDGMWCLFERGNHLFIGSMLDTSIARQVSREPVFPFVAAWSADSKTFAYSGVQAIVIGRIDASGEMEVLEGQAHFLAFADRDRALIVDLKNGAEVIDLRSGKRKWLADSVSDCLSDWTGGKVLLCSGNGWSEYYLYDFATGACDAVPGVSKLFPLYQFAGKGVVAFSAGRYQFGLIIMNFDFDTGLVTSSSVALKGPMQERFSTYSSFDDSWIASTFSDASGATETWILTAYGLMKLGAGERFPSTSLAMVAYERDGHVFISGMGGNGERDLGAGSMPVWLKT